MERLAVRGTLAKIKGSWVGKTEVEILGSLHAIGIQFNYIYILWIKYIKFGTFVDFIALDLTLFAAAGSEAGRRNL